MVIIVSLIFETKSTVFLYSLLIMNHDILVMLGHFHSEKILFRNLLFSFIQVELRCVVDTRFQLYDHLLSLDFHDARYIVLVISVLKNSYEFCDCGVLECEDARSVRT